MQSTTTATVNTASSATPAASTVSVAMDTTTDSAAPSSSSSSSSSSFSSAAAAAAASASSSSSSSVGGGVLAYAVTSLVLTDESMALRLCAEPLASFGVVDLHFKTVPTASDKSLRASIELVSRLMRVSCVRSFTLDKICVASEHFTLHMANSICFAVMLSAKVAPSERRCVLEELNFSHCKPVWKSNSDRRTWFALVCRAISACGWAGLVSLSLNHFGINDDALTCLIPALQNSGRTLRTLDLSYNAKISDVGAVSLIALLSKIATLRTFEFIEGTIPAAAAKFLGASLADPTHALAVLMLAECCIFDDAAVELAAGIALSQHLEFLSVMSNQFGEQGACALFRAIGMCPTMETLECSCLPLSSTSVRALSDALSCPTSRMREVDLACTSIDTDGSRHIGEALKKNKTLQSLNMYANQIDTCDAAFADGIRANTSLRELLLTHGSLGDKGLCALADALAENRGLVEVDVAVNGAIEQRTLARLVFALKSNATMQTLTVGNREFGLTTESELIAELARIPALKGLVFCDMNC